MSVREALGRAYRGGTNIDFIGRRKLWFAISGLFLLFSAVVLAIPQDEVSRCGSFWPLRGLSCGIEFKGGVQLVAEVSDPDLQAADPTEVVSTVRDALSDTGIDNALIQVSGEGDDIQVLVQTSVLEPEESAAARATISEITGASVEGIESLEIGSKWGSEITEKALRALVIFMIVLFLFITWRFEVKMAIAAVIALVHDMAITAGVYALVGFEVTPSTVIAILTILGYSLYDTVVVFDKVEEKVASGATTGKMTYQDAANTAMNEVFMRSLNTSLATLLPIAALLFVGAGLLGASTLKDLALALLVGILVGAYSSIFTATPVLSLMKEREEKYVNVREKLERTAKRLAEKPVVTGASTPEETGSASVASATESVAVARPAAGSKKAKRRRKR